MKHRLGPRNPFTSPRFIDSEKPSIRASAAITLRHPVSLDDGFHPPPIVLAKRPGGNRAFPQCGAANPRTPSPVPDWGKSRHDYLNWRVRHTTEGRSTSGTFRNLAPETRIQADQKRGCPLPQAERCLLPGKEAPK